MWSKVACVGVTKGAKYENTFGLLRSEYRWGASRNN